MSDHLADALDALYDNKTAENGQIVRSEPVGPTTPPYEEMFERGWEDLSVFGMSGGGWYRGSTVGMALAIQLADVKARDISKAEMLLWKRRGPRGWEMVEPGDDPLAMRLMTKPNDTDMTWPEFWRMVVLHLELSQNAYVLKRIATDGTILEYLPLMPARCRPLISSSGRIFYQIYAGTEYERAQLGDNSLIVPADQVIHFRGRMLDGLNGISNGVLGNPIIALLAAIGDYQTNLFGNDGKQPLVFETDQTFGNRDESDAAFQRLKNQLTVRSRKAKVSGDPILLEAGLKARTIALDAKDSATTESFTQQVMRMCGLFDVPPHRIYALEAVAYNNMSAMNRQYAQDCLIPVANNIEVKFQHGSLDMADWPRLRPEFDRLALMQNDPETLDKLLKTAMTNGLMTFDEGREYLPFRLNPYKKGGDQRMVGVNMSLIGPDGEIVRAGVGQNATNPGAGESQSDDNLAKGLRIVGGSEA